MSQTPAATHPLRELIVPAIMLCGIGLYVYDSLHLSIEAMVFPGLLVLVIIAALLWLLAARLVRPSPAAAGPSDDDDVPGPVLDAKPWLMVALPAVLVASLEYIGTLAALVALVFGGQAILGMRSPVRSLLIAVAVVAPTYVVFKYFLYARFPAGLLGIG